MPNPCYWVSEVQSAPAVQQDQVPGQAGQADRDEVRHLRRRVGPIRAKIQNLAVLPNNPKPAGIYELLAHLEHLVGRLTPGSYGSNELLF